MRILLLVLGVILMVINITPYISTHKALVDIISSRKPEIVFKDVTQHIKVRSRPPIGENYITWALTFLPVQKLRDYEFLSYERALRAGSGTCSQNAIMLSGIFEYLGYDADIIALGGHVVAYTNGAILDAGFKTILPFNLSFAEKNIDAVVSAYRKAGVKKEDAEKISKLYAPPNKTYKDALHYRPRLYWFRKFTHTMKWVIPLMLIVFGLNIPTSIKNIYFGYKKMA